MESLEGGHRLGLSTNGNQSRPHYTHKSLLEITQEDRIDSACHELYFHGSSKCRDEYHPIDHQNLIALIRHQPGKYLNHNCQHLGIQGAGGQQYSGLALGNLVTLFKGTVATSVRHVRVLDLRVVATTSRGMHRRLSRQHQPDYSVLLRRQCQNCAYNVSFLGRGTVKGRL